MTPAVEASDLFRIFPSDEGASAALQGLSLTVEEGELVVVFGPSGSGKSTLLRILAGLDRPSAGSVRVFGEDLRTLRGRALLDYRSRTLGYADQHYTRALAPELTAREQIAFRLGLLGVSARARVRAADELLERVGVLDRRDARPGELSGGQQQRVALAVALAHRPRLFIADEPTGELDAANAAHTYALIRELARATGVTTILVSHDPESAAVAERVVQIRDGRVSSETRDGEARAVVNKGGWIRVPEELLRRAGLERSARIEIDERGLLVSGDGAPAGAPPAAAEASARPAGPVVAETHALAKAYGDRTVFRDLSASFAAGGLTAVTGPSGSGKSTLLHLLAGLDLPTEGEVTVLGTAVTALDATARAELRRSRVALVTQGTDLVPFLGAQEAVALGLAMRGIDRVEAERRAAAALADVGLAELAAQRVSRLSMGERQRVALARALAARPALLLADEPTARLDEANARAIGALFAELAARTGAAVVCATHDPVLIEHAHAEVPVGASLAA
ncbi:MAG TPA: ATP-binding cassette domain-containing protein [Gaiellaceae bacterium]|nr:ATP-binding cassette domain-containing protein [Gaiellaceae bacterium]